MGEDGQVNGDGSLRHGSEELTQKDPPQAGRAFLFQETCRIEREIVPLYLGGAGMNPSRLRPGSGLGLGFGAFLASFLPLSLLPMRRSVTQEGCSGEGEKTWVS